MAPIDWSASWSGWPGIVLPLLIGAGFGATLEQSGFGDSRKLAAQFYLKDLTVLKVMFTGIVVAAVLIALASGMGWLDMDRVWVNPTFLLPGVVGGLIMGVGFIIGGFCPGTSVVAASTLKLDGVAFLGGVTLGLLAFLETLPLYEGFWTSTDMGRFTLPDLLNADTGVVVLGVVAMALFAFLLAEVSEAIIGRGEPAASVRFLPRRRTAWAFGGGLLALALLTVGVGQPDVDARWDLVAEEAQGQLDRREVYIHPLEVAELLDDTAVAVRILDVRTEQDYNLFHLRAARHVTLADLRRPEVAKELAQAPGNMATFVVSNDDQLAAEGWRLLRAHGVPNLYILEGGVNRWLELHPAPPCLAYVVPVAERRPEQLAYVFRRAVGDCCNQASPEVRHRDLPNDCFLASHPDSLSARSAAGQKAPEAPVEAFTRKVKLQKKAAVKGGCG